MNRALLIILFTATTASTCAPTGTTLWHNPNVSQAQADKDAFQCRQQAIADWGYSSMMVCMRNKGYTHARYP